MSKMTSEHWLYPEKKGGRVEITWNSDLMVDLRDVVVKLDGETIGTIPNKQKFEDGKDFSLPDGSMLRVQMNDMGIKVWRNGEELPPDPGDLSETLRWSLIFFGIIVVLVSVATLLFPTLLNLPKHAIPSAIFKSVGHVGYALVDLLFGLGMIVISRYVSWRTIPPVAVSLTITWAAALLFMLQFVSLLGVIIPLLFMTILCVSLILQIMRERRWAHDKHLVL